MIFLKVPSDASTHATEFRTMVNVRRDWCRFSKKEKKKKSSSTRRRVYREEKNNRVNEKKEGKIESVFTERFDCTCQPRHRILKRVSITGQRGIDETILLCDFTLSHSFDKL